jgi:hypothetical protein
MSAAGAELPPSLTARYGPFFISRHSPPPWPVAEKSNQQGTLQLNQQSLINKTPYRTTCRPLADPRHSRPCPAPAQPSPPDHGDAHALLPWQNIALNPLAAFGILLTLGVIGGHIANRIARLPAMTGYVLIGLIIGPASLHILNEDLLRAADLFVNLALGLALFESGRRVDLRWLRAERTLLLSTLSYCLLVFAALYALLGFAGLDWQTSTTMAAIGMATSPIVILEMLREGRAEGQVSDRLTTITALSSLLSLLVFAIAQGSTHWLEHPPSAINLLTPAWLILGSSLLGLLAGLLAIALNHWLGHQRQHQSALLFGLIALLVGLAVMLGTQPSLALLVFGLATRNLRGGASVSEPGLLTGSHFSLSPFSSQPAPGCNRRHWPATGRWPWATCCCAPPLPCCSGWCWHRPTASPGHAACGWDWRSTLVRWQCHLLSMGTLMLGNPMNAAAASMMSVLLISELAGPWLCRLALQQAGDICKEH